jgi:hypothetical protein
MEKNLGHHRGTETQSFSGFHYWDTEFVGVFTTEDTERTEKNLVANTEANKHRGEQT